MVVKTETQKPDDIVDRLWKFFEIIVVGLYSFFTNSIREAYFGYKNGHMPTVRLLKLSSFVSLFFSFKMDLHILKLIKTIVPEIGLSAPTGFLRVIIWTTMAFSPFLFWGWRRYKILQAVIKYLHDAFLTAGLAPKGKTPRLIRDYVTDTDSRALQFLSDGVTVTEMLAKKETLENQLSVKIENIKMDKKFNKLIEIEFATSELTKFYPLDSVYGFSDFTFPIGKTRTELIIGDLKKIPHYLFAGISGSGKSTFIRSMVTMLLANNEDLEVYFVDLKGTEAPKLIDLPRLQTAVVEKDAHHLIQSLRTAIEERRKKFIAVKARDLNEYNKTVIRQGLHKEILPRILFVIDEFAELMPHGLTNDYEGAKKAVRTANWIARTGRSFGVNLVVAVQKPDTQNMDSTTKANLEGILCFRVKTKIQSQVVLDNTKAIELGDVVGRAVWQTSGGELIVQTPLLSDKAIESYTKEVKNESTGRKEKHICEVEKSKATEDGDRAGITESSADASETASRKPDPRIDEETDWHKTNN